MFKPFNSRTEEQTYRLQDFNEMLINTDQIAVVNRYRKQPNQTMLTMVPDGVVSLIVQGPYESVSKYILGTSKLDDLKAMGLKK